MHTTHLVVETTEIEPVEDLLAYADPSRPLAWAAPRRRDRRRRRDPGGAAASRGRRSVAHREARDPCGGTWQRRPRSPTRWDSPAPGSWPSAPSRSTRTRQRTACSCCRRRFWDDTGTGSGARRSASPMPRGTPMNSRRSPTARTGPAPSAPERRARRATRTRYAAPWRASPTESSARSCSPAT